MERKKVCQGSVTVVIALTFMMVSAILLTVTEAARTTAERLYVQTMLDSSLESLFSQYHRTLWNNYRIFSLQYRYETDLKEELIEFMTPYMTDQDFFPFTAQEEGLSLSDMTLITEDRAFEEEALDYMKYGMVSSFISFMGTDRELGDLPGEMKDIFEKKEESENVRDFQKEFIPDEKYLARLEKAGEKVNDLAGEALSAHKEALGRLENMDDSGFYRAADTYKRRLEKLKSGVRDYLKASDELGSEVQRLREYFEENKDSLGESESIINEEISEYEEYIREGGEIREKTEALLDISDRLIERTSEMEEETEEFEDWVNEMERESDEDDDFDAYGERRDYYDSAASEWDGFEKTQFSGKISRIDEEKKKILENMEELIEENFLKLLLPEGASLPGDEKINSDPEFLTFSSLTEPERVKMGEYALKFFNSYNTNEEKPLSGSGALETEYLLYGKETDRENLTLVLKKLIGIRELMNLCYLFSDPQKRNEAAGFVQQVLCAAGNPLVTAVLTVFVLGVWALAQAVEDVRTLLEMGRVPLLHNAESFTVGTEDLLKIASGGRCERKSENGLSYRDYLRIFLFGEGLTHQEDINERMLFRMEKNTRECGEKEGDFNIDKCIYSLRCRISGNSGHIMLDTIAVEKFMKAKISYDLSADAFYSYRDQIM